MNYWNLWETVIETSIHQILKHIFKKLLFSEVFGIVFSIFPKKVTFTKNNGCNPRSGKIANVHYQFVAKTPNFFAFSDLILLPEMRKDSASKKNSVKSTLVSYFCPFTKKIT